jgi:hypothetical protein
MNAAMPAHGDPYMPCDGERGGEVGVAFAEGTVAGVHEMPPPLNRPRFREDYRRTAALILDITQVDR